MGAVTTSEVQRLHALVQAGAGNAGQVVAKGFGAGDMAVDLRLRFARYLGGVCRELWLMLRASLATVRETAGATCATCLPRMQRLPNRLPALDGLRALRSGQLRAAQVFVYLQQLGAQVLCLLNCDNLS